MSKTRSGSYPPNEFAEIQSFSHRWVLQHLEQLKRPLSISYRHPSAHQFDEIAALHKEWFPINYPESYFKSINTLTNCILAVISPADYGLQEQQAVIVGAILFRSRQNSSNENLSWRYFMRTTHSAYITTIGIVEELRGHGIGKQLIRKCLEHCESYFRNTLYLGLHVATYNQEGIPFYESLGFKRADTLYGHYFINGRPYDAHYYILYINGGQPPVLTLEKIGLALKSVIRLPAHLRSLIIQACWSLILTRPEDESITL